MSTVKEILANGRANQKRLEHEAPALAQGFNDLMKSYYTPGVLSRRDKGLMAVTGAVAVRCLPCLALHVNNAIAAGATRAEVLEAAAIGVEYGGGPSYVFARNDLLQFLDEIEAMKSLEVL
ncbi:possible carboxymuconolactone decarboxylase family protein [Candidatus Vecturithrix granuli]|uniref:Possible carboxymuconolactone decarboxylase family protein n=1 Tax=Vecturithrix granuli TaxID=1499967 RepID=A0A081C5Y5_VECG1|nr:possible carboxymuconolactone decarboxylase family protein [Candidatus Vecturithrix granuli]